MRVITRIAGLTIACLLLAGSVFAGDKVFYYHTDPAGTPLAMTDVNGTVVWRADYKPFGEEQSITGTLENNERFVGKEKDKETGLQYFGARYMKDEIGRFITVDPVGPVDPRTSKTNYGMLTNPQRLNRYAYGLNNPYRFIDPDGKWPAEWLKVHQSSINRVLATVHPFNRDILNAQQVVMDTNPKYAHPNMHGMSAPGQSALEAWEGANNFVRSELALARELEKSGLHQEALKHVGKAIHTAGDTTSPPHQGYVGWNENASTWSKASSHTRYEAYDPGAGSALDAATRSIWTIFRSNGPIPKEVLPRP
jgi:RHS repeat-associated protein